MADGSAVLRDSRSESVAALNQTAALVWELCDGRRSSAAIAGELRERYAAPRDEIARSVAAVLARLRELGALDDRPSDTSPPALRRSSYDFLGFRAAIASDSPPLIATLDRLNAKLRARHARRPHASYEARARNGRWELRFQGEELPAPDDLVAAASYLEWHMCGRAIEHRRDLLHVHGAALADARSSVLIPGGAGVGKTTLALALVRRGLQLLADDVVLIHPRSWRPEPFPRSLHVHDDALHRLARVGLRFDRRDRIGEYLCATAVGAWPREPGPRIRYVLLPRRTPRGAAILAPVSQAEAAVELLRCSANLGGRGDAWPALVADLLRDVGCYALHLGGNLAAAAAAVQRLLATRI